MPRGLCYKLPRKCQCAACLGVLWLVSLCLHLFSSDGISISSLLPKDSHHKATTSLFHPTFCEGDKISHTIITDTNLEAEMSERTLLGLFFRAVTRPIQTACKSIRRVGKLIKKSLAREEPMTVIEKNYVTIEEQHTFVQAKEASGTTRRG